MLGIDLNPAVSDTTGDAICTTAGYLIYLEINPAKYFTVRTNWLT
jgi:hypothetical protein